MHQHHCHASTCANMHKSIMWQVSSHLLFVWSRMCEGFTTMHINKILHPTMAQSAHLTGAHIYFMQTNSPLFQLYSLFSTEAQEQLLMAFQAEPTTICLIVYVIMFNTYICSKTHTNQWTLDHNYYQAERNMACVLKHRGHGVLSIYCQSHVCTCSAHFVLPWWVPGGTTMHVCCSCCVLGGD